MKIAFDTSVLGAAYYLANESRTGVFRVAEKLWVGLQNSDHEVLIASPFQLGETQRFLGKPSLHSDSTCWWAEKELQFYELFSRDSTGQKMARWAWFQIVRQRNPRYPLREDVWKHLELYHSPFHPLPPEIQRQKKIKSLVTVHDLIPKIHPEFFGAWHIHNANELLAGLTPETFVACVSEATKNDLLNWCPNLTPERVSVIPLAADRQLFYQVLDPEKIQQVRRRYQIPDDVPYFLSVSTLEPRKNVSRTVEAFRRWVKAEPSSQTILVLVGSKGWKIDQLLADIQQDTQLKGRIFFTGYVDDTDLAPLYSGAQVFIYPSLYEGFGLPVLEAMQCGTPVVTSHSSSLPEVVGDAGFLVDPLSIDSIQEGLHQASLNGDQLRDRVADQVRQFDWENFEQAYQSLYQHIHTV